MSSGESPCQGRDGQAVHLQLLDVDGDGQPEIGIASSYYYTVFETDGSVKWKNAISEFSSGMTGASVFDFEGDGNAELVYHDEEYLRIYRGRDGAVLYQIPLRSGTAHEYPVVVDVDGDGNAEIVTGQLYGLYVIGDDNDTWVPTRQIWNQHSYHITNVNDDGTIPAAEENSWEVHNTYRCNLQPGLSPFTAPDLTASNVQASVNGDVVTFNSRIGNGGCILVQPGISVAFYDGDPNTGGTLLGAVETVTRLDPGCFEDVAITLPINSAGDIWVVADDDGTGKGRVSECDEINNIYHPNLVISPLNHPPEIVSAAVTTGAEGEAYSYQVEATDADPGDVLTFSLRVAPEGMSIDSATGLIHWLPGASDSGQHAVQVLVTDQHFGRDIQVFSIDIEEAVNFPPTITSDPITTATSGVHYRYMTETTDPDGDALDYAFLSEPDGMTIHPVLGIVDWVPTTTQIGRHDVILRADDGNGGIDIQSFQINVLPANTLPVITSAPPRQAVASYPYGYRVHAQDADNDPLAFQLETAPEGMFIDEATGVVSWTPTAAQIGAEHPVKVVVDDGRGGKVVQLFEVDVLADADNDPPIIASTPRQSVQLGRRYASPIIAVDPNMDPLSYQLDLAPVEMTIDQTGLMTWDPFPAQLGTHDVAVRVEDGRGGVATLGFTVDVIPNPDNRQPEILSAPRLTATVGQPYEYDLKVGDADGDFLVFALDTSPTGMSLDPVLGTLRWTPTSHQIATHDVVVHVFDGQGGSASQSFAVTVRGTNVPPLITSTPPTIGASEDPYVYAVRASDPEGDPLAFSLTEAPNGMTIDEATGLLEWMPQQTQVGSHVVEILVADGQGGFAFQSFGIIVTEIVPNEPPVITSTPSYWAAVDVSYEYQLAAMDPENEAISFLLLEGPTGMAIDSASWSRSSGLRRPRKPVPMP